jgi:hypothetical protein
MRSLITLVLLGAACTAGSPPSESGSPPGDVRAAWKAYSAYCSLCKNGSPCCLKESDFAPERWSKQSGPYLKAMRDFYDCEFAESSRPEVYSDRIRGNDPATAESIDFPTMSNYARNCEPHACQRYGDLMIQELDRALAAPSRHAEGALVACSSER